MECYVKEPIFFEENRVWRVYKGGYLLGKFLGVKREDDNYPEEWIASVVEAVNQETETVNEGLSFVKNTNITLNELITAYPKEMLGSKSNIGILVKYLDSAIRLPMQVHPDQEFSKKYFQSNYGKSEMWLVLDVRENASIYYGFKEKLSEEQFSELIERTKYDKNAVLPYLNRVYVKPGEVYMIPGKAVHAIGEGCLILEIQEPSDYTIQPEYWCGGYSLSRREMYMGLSKEEAIRCFDYDLYGEKCIRQAKKLPEVTWDTEEYKKEILIGKKDTLCFEVNRYIVRERVILKGEAAVYVVINGTGKIESSGYKRTINKGEFFFLPAICKNHFEIVRTEESEIEIIECIGVKDYVHRS